MTKLEQIEYRLNYLLSQYEDRKNDPAYKLQISLLAAGRKSLLKQQEQPIVDAD